VSEEVHNDAAVGSPSKSSIGRITSVQMMEQLSSCGSPGEEKLANDNPHPSSKDRTHADPKKKSVRCQCML